MSLICENYFTIFSILYLIGFFTNRVIIKGQDFRNKTRRYGKPGGSCGNPGNSFGNHGIGDSFGNRGDSFGNPGGSFGNSGGSFSNP